MTADAGETPQRTFRFVLDRLRNGGVICGQCKLHDNVVVAGVDPLDQAERNDVATEAGIFHRLERFSNLILGNRHRNRKLRGARAE